MHFFLIGLHVGSRIITMVCEGRRERLCLGGNRTNSSATERTVFYKLIFRVSK